MDELITPQPGFPLSAMIWYYLGAGAWLTAYMLVIYKIIKNRYNSYFTALLGAAFLVASPRIFAESFYNSKDI